MKPSSFAYHRPDSLEEALDLLAELGDEAKVLAGGQSLVPMLALRLTAFEHLVELPRTERLRAVRIDDSSVSIGAAVTQAEIERSDVVAEAVPLLTQMTPFIGHFQIRNRGTLGGSVAHADPAAEYPTVALTLDAEMELLSKSGSRRVPAAAFFTGLWSTVIRPDELLVSVTFPRRSGRQVSGCAEFARRHGDFAVAGAAISLDLDAAGLIARCSIGLIGLGSTPERGGTIESEVVGSEAGSVDGTDVGLRAMSALGAIPDDLHGSANYRRRVGAAMVARAWRAAVQQAFDE